MLYDVIIIGGGPAGAAAAVYTARKKLKTLLLPESFGGQSIVSDDIHNWIGEINISGFDLAKKLENHVRDYAETVDIKMPEKVVEILTVKCEDDKRTCDFEIKTDKGNMYQGKTIILCAGARRRKLSVPGEDKLSGKGVAYCSTCDAPLFSGKTVAVVGGGNAGLEAVVDLFPYATKVYLMHRGETLKGDPSTQEDIRKNPKAKNPISNNCQGNSASQLFKALPPSLKKVEIKGKLYQKAKKPKEIMTKVNSFLMMRIKSASFLAI
jgi:alkyl hydroperoxide reductase subunit AhpF